VPLKKAKPNHAHVIYVLDRSGSMNQFGEEGYTSIQNTIKELPEQRGEDCRISIFAFDHEYKQIANNALAKEYTLPEDAIKPRGMTALRDALREAIEFAGTAEGEKFMVVFTDGQDNSSKTSPEQIKNMLRALDNVDISWLAAAEADMSTAEYIGIDAKDVMKVGCTGDNMTQAMRSSSCKTPLGFTQAQRQSSVR
tara:strand:+ start:3274 stop:3861 length:588 start_codon:yes stop_codon:yes gene_type:complete